MEKCTQKYNFIPNKGAVMPELKADNRIKKPNGNRKPLVAAVCVVLAVAVLFIVFLAAKSPVFLAAAEKRAERGEFSKAMESVSQSSGEKAEILEKYIALRLEIIESYPELLTEFNIDKIHTWRNTVDFISGKSDLLSEGILLQVQSVSQVLDGIIAGVAGYEAMREDVLSMMDVFNELNRLSSKDAEGNSIGFTVAEERAKISQWEQKCNALEEYSRSVEGSESIYLLNYLIKETQGECVDLNGKLDIVIQSGYSETDNVRLNIEGTKRYPDIRSSSASVNLLEKENYELYVYKGICRALVETLGEFYVPE